ncbi:pyridine nucleotide-disulfide oxidoreductase [Labrys sp. KNU-23]|uniref:FAD/NAD(P)-binding protein n=1 Tax=Labrys sp. KNU-23 TaxID=2789216 RepID=UPI0011EC95A9|nr:FAD/NAD(P)-binding protein [Labrys sp. KNU-23]QEN84892.1 pyridine nucleotide-disulfide oxidoreductase [Labrys sp. KNU-23]
MPDASGQSFSEGPIVILGGGVSGALLAARLLGIPGKRQVVVVDDAGPPGRGLAYSTAGRIHLVNANAGRMSADPDDADHFTNWLARFVRRGGWPEAPNIPVSDMFAPRSIYGLYIQELLADAVTVNARHGRRFQWLPLRAVDVNDAEGGLQVHFHDGAPLSASVVVLATGIHSRSGIRGPAGRPRGVLDPWHPALEATAGADARIAIVGAGLTMVDAVVSLQHAGHRGPIDVISRHGLKPHPRRLPPEWPDFLAEEASGISLGALTRKVRRECRAALRLGIDWQAPLDMVHAHIARFWHAASDLQRRRFVRLIRPFWESHHHRSPPQAALLLDRLVAEGRLRHIAADVQAIDTSQRKPRLTMRLRGSTGVENGTYDAVIVSSGVEYDWRRVDQPLPRNLLQRGWVRPGPLGLGIDATTQFRVIDRHGEAFRKLLAIGPPLRGLWWESTAIVDIARQASELAGSLVEYEAANS